MDAIKRQEKQVERGKREGARLVKRDTVCARV